MRSNRGAPGGHVPVGVSPLLSHHIRRNVICSGNNLAQTLARVGYERERLKGLKLYEKPSK